MKSKLNIFNKYIIPFRFRKFYKEYKNSSFNLLDVGCGPYNVLKTKIVFPKCNYYGLDKCIYNVKGSGYDLMKDYYNIDLLNGDLSKVPDNFFDVVMCLHVLEHITNGLYIVEELTKKVKPNGRIYIEFPSVRTLSLPSIPATFNFCDDDTHIRLYSIQEIVNILLSKSFKIIRAGKKRDIFRILLMPVYYVVDRYYYKHGYAGAFYDILGWAEYVYAQKREMLKSNI